MMLQEQTKPAKMLKSVGAHFVNGFVEMPNVLIP